MAKEISTPNTLAAPEMEQTVLGILLLEELNGANWRRASRLKTEMFTTHEHKYIFNKMKQCVLEGLTTGLLFVNNKMRDDGMDGTITHYMTELSSKVTGGGNIEHYAFIIEQKWIAREIIRVSDALKADATKKDALELLEDAKRMFMDLTPRIGHKLVRASDQWNIEAKMIEKNAQRFASGISLAGVTSGFKALDNITLGWMPREYYLVAARPAMGKTAFLMALARAAAMAGHPVHITSLEMGAGSLIRRLVAYETMISTWRMRQGDLTSHDFDKMNAAADKILKNIYIEDGSVRDIDGIYNSCYSFKLERRMETDKHPVYMLDYAQLTDAESKHARQTMNREQVISSVSRGWKAICRDMDAPGIALSQLSRAVETRAGNKQPQMSDLRDSGSLEQDADFIGFLYRPEEYDISEYEDGTSTKNTGKILIDKYREGETGSCLLGFAGSRGWYNMGEDSSQESLFPDPNRVQPKNYTIPSHDEEQPPKEDDRFPF